MTMPSNSELQAQVLLLSELFDSLPDTVPFVPMFYPCGLDNEAIEDIGYAGALNQCFHRVWGYKSDGLVIDQRGPKLDSTIAVLQDVADIAEDPGMVLLWVEALIEAAYAAGASRWYVSLICIKLSYTTHDISS